MNQVDFTVRLLEWHKENERALPWKEDKDPYKIWLSEIILQQTRVDQGMPYYLRFIDTFPDVYTLASASEDKVLKLWEGLGYYSRARNLHATAQKVVENLSGQFPENYDDLLKLKGVGPYTAAAISSFAFDLPHAVVDGNVIRVLSRYAGIEAAVDTSSTKKELNELAHLYLSKKDPGAYNQAIMDFGAMMCVPKNPDCLSCPLNDSCLAFANGKVDIIPFKSKRILKKELSLNYHIIFDRSHVLIKKRVDNTIWKGLHDFILSEGGNSDLDNQIKTIFQKGDDIRFKYMKGLGPYTHILTHRKILAYFHFYHSDNDLSEKKVNTPYNLVERKKLSNFAFPTLIKKNIIDAGHLNGNNLFDKVPDKN